ncbi:ABC transporter ATP-binding protein [Lysinibacillus xylanilyticus]|uniref:ABC transporter ATP-binding protein n=1 Tax=Lysinibacillus xylanilyticus TaxID=582475 RepID=UPI002B2542C8|nr:ABC transporter ATP-binding protein [Lysinibacillus xylanilyticus]MEB2302192.1 ABC transporter ATP-binding protein [Lysinibacillus xylanilyticus]
MESIITLSNVSKSFELQQVVKDLSLNIPEGSLYGFLGPNGAGKTTTMRVLIGLIAADKGEIFFKGKNIKDWNKSLFNHVGCFIDSPSYYPNLTAYENLAYIQKITKKPLSEVKRVLKITGIYNAKDKKVKNFSMGMKQRLGLAFAMLNDPDILILDEPTNGLDPEGIHEIRNFLIKLCKDEGKTIFVSSHNLAEIEMMADYIALINQGELIYDGKLEDVLISEEYIVKAKQTEEVIQMLTSRGLEITRLKEEKISFKADQNRMALINKQMVEKNIDVYELTPRKRTLEEMFLDLTKKDNPRERSGIV